MRSKRLPNLLLRKLSLWLPILGLALSTLACEFSDTFTWSRTVMAPTDTPLVTPTSSPEDVGKVDVLVDKKLIRVGLDPLGERDVDGVIVQVYELGERYLVETFDPAGRYLPSANLVVKDRQPEQEVEAVQVNRTWQWGFSTGDNLDILPLMYNDLGQIPLGTLHQYEPLQWGQSGINLIFPMLDVVDDSMVMQVYQTPAAHTALVVPQSYLQAGGSGRMAALSQLITSFDQFVVLSFFGMPGEPVSAYLRAAQAMPVSDYLGLDLDDLDWAILKAKEDRNGLPLEYVPPKGIAEETVHWLNYDQTFIHSLYFVPFEREEVPCTDKDQLETVIDQSPAADTVVNLLAQPVTLYICNEVLSQSKYQTVTYKTDTPTITLTPRDTATPAPTRTVTPTITQTLTGTLKPSSTSKPSSTPVPSQTSTTAPPEPTTAPTGTTAPTATTEPPLYDDFATSPTGYDDSLWTVIYTIGGTQEWRGAEKTFLQTASDSSFPNIYSNEACLLGTAQFRIKTSESGTGSFLIGWVDDPVMASIANGLFLESLNTDQVSLVTMQDGAITSTPLSVASRDTTWHTYLLSWIQDPDDLSITASVSVDGGTATVVSSTVPDVRLNFIAGAYGLAGGDAAWIETDYVKILSESCE